VDEATSLGYTAAFSGSKADVNTESSLIDAAIAKHAAGIVLDPADAQGSIANVKKANAANIPVVLVNAEIDQTGLTIGQLVSNNAQGAQAGAQQWVQMMGDTAKYLELYGMPSDNNAQTRHNGYMTVFSQFTNLKPVQFPCSNAPTDCLVANWDKATAQKAVQSVIQGHQDLQGVIAGNDEMAAGAIAALQQAGKTVSADPKKGIMVGGFDGSPTAVDYIKQGVLAYTVLQPVANFSKLAVQQLDAYIRTGAKPAQEKQSFDCILITKDNVDKMTGPFVYSG